MLPDIRALLILQDRDRRLLDRRHELERLPQDEQRAKAKLAHELAAVAKAKEAFQSNELAVKKVELDAQTRRTTIQRLKTQQFETRKNDEFQALGHEVTRYEKDIDALETQELELMEAADALRQQLADAQKALAATQVLVDADIAQISERRERLEAEVAELKQERATLAQNVSEDVLPLYERLLKTKAGVAISPLKEGRCGGCHMKLITATVVKVQAGTQVTQCEDCGRILYAD